MSQAGGGAGSWTSMNENLMALLEAVLTLAASDASTTRRPARPAIKPGGYSEDIFFDLTDSEQDDFSCSICYQVLKESMQCENEHKFCHSCLYVWSTTGQYSNRVHCPVCRCQGYYFRNDDLDERINRKRVRCSLEGCTWTGTLRYLGSHRHTNYTAATSPSNALTSNDDSDDDDDDDDEEESDDEDDGTVLELPYLGRAPPRLPHRHQSRFTGTGLQARSMLTTTAGAAAAVAASSSDLGNPTVQTTTTALGPGGGGGGGALLRQRLTSIPSSPSPDTHTTPSIGGGGGVLLRERRNTAAVTASPDNNPVGGATATAGRERRTLNPLSYNSSSNAGRDVLLRERRLNNGSTPNRLESSSSVGGANANAAAASIRERRSSGVDASGQTAVAARPSGQTAAAAARPSGQTAATPRPSVRQRVHPIRRPPVNRISVSHTDNNNNLAAITTTTTNSSDTATAATTTNTSVAESEGGAMPSLYSPASPLSTPRQPRPPSAPRPANLTLRARRALPGLSTTTTATPPAAATPAATVAAASPSGSPSPPTPRVIRAPPTFNAATASSSTQHHSALNNFHDRLQESRSRLEGLMSSFSGELERSRQEMADFQVERERQRREQLTEVRELGRRLGQVATELRTLLNHRTRFQPAESQD